MSEQTSRRVAKIAGRILELKLSAEDRAAFEILMGFPWANVRTVCASCLTQAANEEDWTQRRGAKRVRATKGRHRE